MLIKLTLATRTKTAVLMVIMTMIKILLHLRKLSLERTKWIKKNLKMPK